MIRCWAAAGLLLALLVGCAPGTPDSPVANPESYPAPPFTLAALDGSPVSLSDFRGQWVVLNFWATWCTPCVEELPALQALADATAGEATVLGVNLREDASAVRAFAREHSIRFPLLLNPEDATVLAYAVTGLPQTLLIDPAGWGVERSFGPVNPVQLEERIRSGV